MQSSVKTVKEYLSELPEDRREAIEKVREVILKNLPEGYEESMQYGMISYVIPHSIYTEGYHCDPKQAVPFISLASQKNHMAIYFMHLYLDKEADEWFRNEYKATGKKLDMGKSCLRFKNVNDLPLEIIGKTVSMMPVKKYLEKYESIVKRSKGKK